MEGPAKVGTAGCPDVQEVDPGDRHRTDLGTLESLVISYQYFQGSVQCGARNL